VRESLDASADGSPQALRIEATDDLGRLVTSSSVYLNSSGTKSNADADWITFAAIAVWLEVNDKDYDVGAPATNITATYYGIGLRGFGVQKIDTRAGSLRLLASAKVDNFDQITGRFDITASQAQVSIDEWLGRADDVSYDLLDILSLADGRLIRWSVRSLSRDGRTIATEFRGPSSTGRPRRGFHHWLDLQPVLELSLKYTSDLKEQTGIDVAIEWSLMNPRYLELDFVACMTALEHLTDVFENSTPKLDPPGRAYFKSTIVPALAKALEGARLTATSPDAVVALDKASGKLNDLNRMTLQDSITAMLQAYAVPLSGLERVLPDLIMLRNDIVHRGVARRQFQPQLQKQVNVVREILTRVFLKLLGFTGKYHSYLSGRQEFVTFPNV
jgi:hypothetical protein